MSTATIDRQLSPLEVWLQSRRTLIGASESPAILGCGYKDESPWTIWAKKRGIAEDTPDTELLRWGRRLQPVIIDEFRERTGLDVLDVGEFTIQRHAVLDWLGCTLDGLIPETDEGKAVVEVKNVNVFAAGDWKGDDPPLRHNVQCQHQMEVTGAHVAYVVGLIGGNRLAWKKVYRSQRFIDAMLPHLAAFWRLVCEGVPPAVDGSEATKRALQQVYFREQDTTVLLGAKEAKLATELTALKAAEKSIKDRKTHIENLLKAEIKEANRAVFPDGSSLTWKWQHSNGYTVEPFDSRVLRQHKSKGPTIEHADFRMARATAELLKAGATLFTESPSGSRYFELAGGLKVRVSDHEPNQKTESWIDRQEVAQVRVDLDDWTDQLTAITGNPESED